jgi:hypothetical protein
MPAERYAAASAGGSGRVAETRRFTSGERRRNALGVASLVLSVFPGALFLLLVSFASFLNRWTYSPAGEIDAPGLGVLVLLLTLACLFSIFVAMALAATALVRPGRGWPTAVAGWMVGVSVLWYAGTQDALWTPFGGGANVPTPESAPIERAPAPPEEAPGMRWVEPEIGSEEMGPHPPGPPGAILTSARRDAIGFEGTFCWAPEWAENCVEDAGVPLLPETETIAVERGKAADLAFAGRDPVLTGAVAYPLEQEAKTVPAFEGVRYLVPQGERRTLNKEELELRREGGLTKIFADVPEGEYVFQISARPPGDVDTWKVATYHFRVLVLPDDGT